MKNTLSSFILAALLSLTAAAAPPTRGISEFPDLPAVDIAPETDTLLGIDASADNPQGRQVRFSELANVPGLWKRKSLASMPGDYGGERIYPGDASGTMTMYPNRVYAVPYPLDDSVGLSQIIVPVSTAGQSGATLRIGVYDDFKGRPGKLLTSGTVAAATTGKKTVTFPTVVPGGQWLWIAIAAQNCDTTQPVVHKFINSPYRVQRAAGALDLTYENQIVTYENGITGALAARWTREMTFMLWNVEAPVFAMHFAANPGLPTEPDRWPLILPTEAEDNIACEPNMAYFANRPVAERYVMTFTTGWLTPVTTWATAPAVTGPWTRKGTFPAAGRGFLFVDPADDHIYFYSAGTPLKCHHGATMEAMVASTAVDVMSGTQTNMPNRSGIFQNTSVIRETAGVYKMLFDGQDSVIAPNIWQAGLATASSPLGPWTVATWPLTTLRQTIADGAGFGLIGHTSAGHLYKDGSTYRLWYHAADYGNLPGEIFHATSTDLVTWTVDPVWRIRREHPLEWDQAADPFFFTDPVTSKNYILWSAMNNEDDHYAAVMISNPNVMPVER